jgi:hypothetical protein
LPIDALRLRLCLLIISAFLCGGVAGAFAFRYMSYSVLFIPASITGVIALAYGVYQTRKG